MCPECASDDIRVEEYDFGVCRETGYHDAGEIFICRSCGARGDVDELVIPDEDSSEPSQERAPEELSEPISEGTNEPSDSNFGVVQCRDVSGAEESAMLKGGDVGATDG
jgi:hypothetical protein